MKIETPFVCDQRADCCREQPYIVVSTPELALLTVNQHCATRPFLIQTHPGDPGFYRLLAQPCPFLRGNACTIYDIRPYNCRRFICGRPSGSTEPYEQRANGECLNFTQRLKDLRFFRHAREVQAAAQPWALEHGWTP